MKLLLGILLCFMINTIVIADEPANYRLGFEGFGKLPLSSHEHDSYMQSFYYEKCSNNINRLKFRLGILHHARDDKDIFGDNIFSQTVGWHLTVSKVKIKSLSKNIDAYYEYGGGLSYLRNKYHIHPFVSTEVLESDVIIPIGIATVGVIFYDSQYISVGISTGLIITFLNSRNTWGHEINLNFIGILQGALLQIYF